MNIGVLGTGMVGNAIGTKLVQLGHKVKMGSRTADNPKAAAWVKANGASASQGTFADAAQFGELLFNCTAGMASLEVLKLAGADNLKGKILIDIANPLDFSKGMPPSLSVCNTDSLGEQIQRAFPDLKVVKTLNTVNCNVMVNPTLVPGDHDIFVSGNDSAAKAKVTEILKNWFGWKSVIDLGDITTARGTEMLLPIWIRLWGILQTPNFNFKIAR
ncbi:MAG: NAD(P)-binding domain-containing protein [candidate division KSB1 bacterium]|nr:NAD(P)-binding domain-containing protein [candidate division KSB1 bacterium]MDZ7301921.1 NAD(P)-binding domain-containing protein [candidate division KSB1 bacterium]MDZ7314248.1 NAD(P)-binding domain-containing protein [candidate division KSB1 bacterium]